MNEQKPESLVILFADVAGSTRLYERRGNAVAQKIIGACLGYLRDIVSRTRGSVIKEIGDEVMCTFCQAEDAASAAEDMQRTVQQASAFGKFDNEQVRIRVGFHFGPVVREEADVFGDAVNVAARVVAQAKAQQILTTRETMQCLPESRRANARMIDRVMVKGKTEHVELHELLWDIDNLNGSAGRTGGRRCPDHGAACTFCDKEYSSGYGASDPRFGRGEENELVIPDGLASRLYGRWS